jgi:hypothetical protein
MKPPTFFLSSTIFDFKDLRSAVKYYLEHQGCRVLASEFNDFPKPLDTHSYEACLRAIKQADWFVLLIGTRVGGWYDEAARVSITQQEYREAYKLHLKGRLKLLNFVRSDVWRLKEDRKELARHLDGLGVDPGAKARIVNFPCKSASDAEFLTGFINEVGRNRETLAARASGACLPTGNWIHVFDSFKDVIDAIQFQPLGGRPVEEATLRRLLMRELREFLRISLVKARQGRAFSPRHSVDLFHSEHQLTTADRRRQSCLVHTKSFDQLCSLAITLMTVRYHPQVLLRAIESPVFLRYDLANSCFTEEPVYEALVTLSEEIRRFTMANSPETLQIVFETSPRAMPVRGDRLEVDTVKLFGLLHLLDRWCNIIELCMAIVNFLRGQEFAMPDLRPRSFLIDMNEELKREEVTNDELDAFLNR